MIVRFIVPALLVLTSAAQATELRSIKVRTGTDGLDPAPLTITNASRSRISCNADIAHWYSVELAKAEAGTDVRVDLWFDPASGTYATLNGKRENLPVERLWCGLAGRAYETRSQIALDKTIGLAPAPKTVTCENGPARLDCR